MIVEIAQIDVKPGMEAEFEAGYKNAVPLFKRAKGCHGVEIPAPCGFRATNELDRRLGHRRLRKMAKIAANPIRRGRRKTLQYLIKCLDRQALVTDHPAENFIPVEMHHLDGQGADVDADDRRKSTFPGNKQERPTEL
jgi:hypothetical protein